MLGSKGIDKKTYISFITDNKEMLYKIAYSYLRDENKALEAVDESVYLGYKNRHTLREIKYFKTWLTRILINECYKILRKDKREVTMEVLPEEAYIDNEDSFHLKLAVQNLPDDLKKVIVLRYFGGYTIKETAEILEIPEGTAATRARKALSILKVEINV